MSDNWVVQNLENALDTWNSKLTEIWKLVTQTPQQFKGGSIWKVIQNIHGAMLAIGLALLVLFFVVGVMKTCSSLTEVKKPEHALKLFIRFALAKGVVTYGLQLMLAIFDIVQGTITKIMTTSGLGSITKTTLPKSIITSVEKCGFFESIPLWAVNLIGGLIITVLSCVIFSLFASSPPVVDTKVSAVTQVWKYIGELIFNMLVLVGTVKMSDRVVREMMGL